MSNPLSWHKFWFKKWSLDEVVNAMTLEQVGAYWQLLVHQMLEGSIPDSVSFLARILNVHDVDHFTSRIWDPDPKVSEVKVRSLFVSCPGKPGRLYNVELSKIMDEDFQKRDNHARAGQASREARAREQARKSGNLAPDPDSPLTEVSDEEYATAVKEFPKRKEWREGLDEGERLMRDTITTREQYSRFLAAVKSYRRACSKPGHDKKFTMKLDNFMQKWTDFVPDNVLHLVPAEPKAAEAPGPSSQEAEARRRADLAKVEGLPWEQLPPDRAAKLWPEERRRAYVLGEPVSAEG